MATAAPRKLSRVKSDVAQIGTSKYEQASAMLSSALLLLAMMTIVMFIVWLSATIIWDRPVAKVTLQDVGGGGSGNNMQGGDKDM